jgi:Leucine-rich repeat (LRR) protein
MSRCLFFSILCTLTLNNVSAQSRALDSLTLMDLYLSANGQSWRTNTNWVVFGQPIDTWYGITLDAQGRVAAINLNSNNLKGTLPQQTLGNLSNLVTLNLKDNQLSGNVPNFFAPSLVNLYLNNNQFTGSVPNFNAPNLTLAYLGHNQFSGTLPQFNLFSLSTLAIDSTRIDSLPNLSGLSSLTTFKVDTNKLTFDDLIPNVSKGMTYTKLDSIYIDTTISKKVGDTLTVNLGIDGAITTSLYTWYKGGTLIARTTVNQLTINNLQTSDAGIYTCRVTNPNFQTLTLYSRKITLNVTINCPIALDTTASAALCAGQTYTSPAGKVYSTSGTYVDSVVFNSPLFACRIIRYTITIRNDTSCHCLDSLSLVGLYNATGGANWTNRANWLSANPISSWYGIRLTQQGCVDQIVLNSNQLTNSIPTLSLSNLTVLALESNLLSGNIPSLTLPNLLSLSFAGNRLTGNIPNLNLPNLRVLYLYDNQLIGSILDLNFPNLTGLFLQNNQLTGSIPNFTMANLGNLWLHNNQFSGTIPDFKIPKLTQLNLSNNQLTGIMPNLNLQAIQSFDFRKNLIDSLPKWTNLPIAPPFGISADTNRLTFDDILPNILTGFTYGKQDSIFRDTTITKNVGDGLNVNLGIDGALTSNLYQWYKNGVPYGAVININQLIVNNLQLTDAGIYTCKVTNALAPNLALYSRKVTVNVLSTCRNQDSLALVALYNATNGAGWTRAWNLSQPITTWTDLMFNAQGCVEEVLLENNNLIGTLPIELGNLASLVTLRLSNNKITGSIPTEMGKLSNLWELDLSGNQLTSLPISLGNLNNLRILNVSSNPFNTTIPMELGNLKRIRYLILSNNGWQNSIPDSLGRLATLQELHLSNNILTGNMPNKLGNLTNLQRLFLQNNQLSGAMPVQLLNLNALTHLNFQSNRFDQMLNFTGLSRFINCAADSNRLTFATILPNIGGRFSFSYATQDSIFKDTTYFRNAADALTIDLNIDNTVTTNVYKWFKNNVLYQTTTSNKLIFNFIRSSDAGTYRCEVTNPNAPLLTLYSRKAILKVNCPIAPQRDTSICQGQLYMAQGRAIGATVGIFFDTLPSKAFCDSLLLKITVHARDSIELPIRDTCDAAGTATQTRRLQNRFGCDSIVNQRFTLATPFQKTVTIWSCNPLDRVRDTTLRYRTVRGCDSTITQQYRFCHSDSTIIRHLVCNRRPDSILINKNFCGCDSIIKHRFSAPNVDTIVKTEPVCDILQEGTTVDVTLHVNPPFCDSSVLITKRVFDRCYCLKDSIIMYNGLIPNDNDNKNDYFIISLVEQYQPNELIVTDKRGMLVYRKQNYQNNWSGTNEKGEPLPEGIYNFVFRTVNPNCIRMGIIDIKYIP